MNTPNQRLRKAREKAGFSTAKEAALAMGVPVSTYIGHENGHRGFPAARVPQYAKKFKVTEEWLLYGKGEPDLQQHLPAGADFIESVPILGEVPAGNWREAVQDHRGWAHIAARDYTESTYALEVSGDSMNKIVEDGALILINPNDRDVFHRRLFVVRDNEGQVTFKRYMDGPGRLEPCSKNPEHKTIPITDRNFEIIGRVTKIILDPDQAAMD